MVGWRIVFTRQARKDAKKLASSNLRSQAEKLIDVLRIDPFQTPPQYKRLVGNLAGAFSLLSSDQHSTSLGLSGAHRGKDGQSAPYVDALQVEGYCGCCVTFAADYNSHNPIYWT